MRKIFGALLLSLPLLIEQAVGQGQIKPVATPGRAAVHLDPATIRSLLNPKLPTDITLPAGKLVEAKQWTDANGQNLLVVLRTRMARLKPRFCIG